MSKELERPLKILMTLMGMEIGGAETHVLELSKMLKRMGVDVHVVSNGGVYVKELEDCGIKHYKVPLHNRQFLNMFSSYKALREIIKKNDFRLVHAHARIPAFICGILQKRLKFKLVTTAHFDFSVAFPFNLLSNWGDRTLAVSNDIKDYLLTNYNVDEHNIRITVNGIDTEKFSPSHADKNLLLELGLKKNTKKIVSVSRLDKVPAIPVHALLDIAEELYLTYEIEIVIVGKGDDYESIQEKAEQINQRVDEKFIHLTGQRTDINKILQMADVFVNVSRAALEALSCQKPVILAGGQGYLGIFNEGVLDAAIATNFTCRGFSETTSAKLYEDIKILLSKPEKERARLGSYGRMIVKDRYSLTKMAKDSIEVYEEMATKPINIVISGYYGYDNSGDDIMLKSIVDNLREKRKSLNFTVLSYKPKETKVKFGVNAVYRFNLLKVFFLLRNTNVLITGGGNLIQDETSTQSLFYYLWVINTARRLGAKNMLYSKGIGPIKRASNIKRVKRTLESVDMITLRELGSLDALNEMGIVHPFVRVTADAAFALPPVTADDEFLRGLGLRRPYFCVSLRSWMNNPPGMEVEVARFADYVHAEFGYQVAFISMMIAQDKEFSEKVMARMKYPSLLVEPDPDNINHGRMVLGMADFTLCMRLHGLIYAVENGVPSIALAYGPKVRQLMEVMDLKWHMPVEEVNYETLASFANEIHENKEAISKKIFESASKLRDLAAKNADYLIELIKRQD